jgi:hypothetical protein
MDTRPEAVQRGGPGKPKKKDRHAFAVVLDQGRGVKVHGGPTNHLAQADEKVTWTIVNGTQRAMTVELTIDERHPPEAPATPFTTAGPYTVDLPAGCGAADSLELRILDRGFPGESTYKYTLTVRGEPGSALDPELDIWP